MLNYNKIFEKESFSMNRKIKKNWFFEIQKKLSIFHYNNCDEYKKLTNNIFNSIKKAKEIENLPFIHTSLFKNFNLTSVKKNKNQNIFSSSGTTGTKKSLINIDRKTSILQSKTLKKIFFEFINNDNIEHIFFVDSPSVLRGSLQFTARGAAIKGFFQLAKKYSFILNENNELNIESLENFIKKNPNKPFIIFGFTSFIWNFFIKKIQDKNLNIDAKNGILIHGGGWKKMQDKSITKKILYKSITKNLNLKNIHDYYGMVEQTGSIFLECEKNFFHSSIFSDVIIRNESLEIAKKNSVGLMQVLSLLPLSYPGHNLLTEDLGILKGEDDCKCGRLGKYFEIIGRVPGTDVRGCSDAN
jgi:phenylacetate-coenzyme A ligase PaaK-like adenylate-forming protein